MRPSRPWLSTLLHFTPAVWWKQALVVAAVALGGCTRDPVVNMPVSHPPKRERLKPPLPHVRFTDITDQAGIHFVHVNGSSGHKLLPETMGSGAAFFDFDNDGDQDLVLVNSCSWPGMAKDGPAPTHAFYKNDGTGRFTDVTNEVGLALIFYGMGAAAADYDNDGFVDLFLSGVGGNHLFRNVKGERFVEVTADAKVGGPGGWPVGDADFLDHAEPINWSSGAAWFDYDNDGFLDLFVCNYVRWSPLIDLQQDFQILGVGRAFGPPTNFAGANNLLYHNRRDGTFEDVSAKAGVEVFSTNALKVPVGKALGVLATDLDEDGWMDLIVANDTVQGFFFHNRGDGTFVESGDSVGLAFNALGVATGAMGIDGAMPRNDGRCAVAVGNFAAEETSFFVRQPSEALVMSDQAKGAGIGAPSRQVLKFGTLFFDFDLDGWLDLLHANGHIEEEINKQQPGQHYEQPAQLYWNSGPANNPYYVLMAEKEIGLDLLRPMVGRGLAYADIDADGDLDVLITANGGRARLFRNERISSGEPTGEVATSRPHWLRLVVEGRHANRSAIGARVEVVAGGGALVQRRELSGGRSYLSQPELPLTFGLGRYDTVDEVRITWPGSSTPQVLNHVPADQTRRVVQNE